MSTPNRIAVVGHRGWASSAILKALAASTASIKVLYRCGSDVTDLPSKVSTVLVDFEDEATLISALQDVDIVISLVGLSGVPTQHALLKAIPKTDVRLFSPSDLAARYDSQGLRIPVMQAKHEVENAARVAGIPLTIILPGNFAEFALSTSALGVDITGNKLIYTADSDKNILNVCTRLYIAAAYASIFAETPISQLANRIIGLSELKFSGKHLAEALHRKHDSSPKFYRHSQNKVDSEIEKSLSEGSPYALAWYGRKIWGTGQQSNMIGTDIWDIPGYSKATLESLVVGGALDSYREMPAEISEYFALTFTNK